MSTPIRHPLPPRPVLSADPLPSAAVIEPAAAADPAQNLGKYSLECIDYDAYLYRDGQMGEQQGTTTFKARNRTSAISRWSRLRLGASIEVSQFHRSYDGRKPKEFPYLPAQHQWQVTFEDFTDVFVSERTISRKDNAGKEFLDKYCTVRFKCQAPPKCEAINRESTIEPPRPLRIAQSKPAGDTGMQDSLEKGEDPARFPLAKVFNPQNADASTGREIRISHKKTRGASSRVHDSGSQPYAWMWPMILRFLANRPFVHNEGLELFDASLDEVAEKTKLLEFTAAQFKVPGSPGFTFPVAGSAPALRSSPPLLGNKRGYEGQTDEDLDVARVEVRAKRERLAASIAEAEKQLKANKLELLKLRQVERGLDEEISGRKTGKKSRLEHS
ncbi:MAG: hypothetical protein Q9174_003020 [Haloplaca sp. 1 TL-2023]